MSEVTCYAEMEGSYMCSRMKVLPTRMMRGEVL